MADFNAGAFKPLEVIMHLIPKGKAPDDGSDPIEYSEVPTDLPVAVRAFLQRRLRATLGGYARPVLEDPNLKSDLPSMVRDLLKNSADLVPHSCAAARALHIEQKWISSGGLVMTIIGEVAGSRCVVIAKMEHQEGLQARPTTNAQGKRTFEAQHLQDLVLGDGTRVFKAGIFIAPAGELLEGFVVDDQESAGGVADYFIHYLGCQFRQQADVQTETFLALAEKFIAQRTKDDPEANATYEIALLAELQSGNTKIRPESFAAQHLSVDDQDLFLQRVRDAGLPTKSFRKDVSLIKSKIRRLRVQTARGADVYAPPDMYEDGSLTVENDEESGSIIVVRDEVTRMLGASGKRFE